MAWLGSGAGRTQGEETGPGDTHRHSEDGAKVLSQADAFIKTQRWLDLGEKCKQWSEYLPQSTLFLHIFEADLLCHHVPTLRSAALHFLGGSESL